MARPQLTVVLSAFLFVVARPSAANGQTSTALMGIVSGQSGRVIREGHPAQRADGSGPDRRHRRQRDLSFTNLRPGTYDVSSTSFGFDTATEVGVLLHLDAVAS